MNMEIFQIAIITLIIYSVVATTIFIITKENENVIIAFGLGIVGLTILGFMFIVRKIQNLFRYHIGKRSIFIETETGKKFKCHTKYTDDICWVVGYNLIKRYASKTEWEDVPDFTPEFIKNSKRNCNNCKYDKECSNSDNIKCKHDDYGSVIEFDKFEME